MRTSIHILGLTTLALASPVAAQPVGPQPHEVIAVELTPVDVGASASERSSASVEATPLGQPAQSDDRRPLPAVQEASAMSPGWGRVIAALLGTVALAVGAAVAFKRFAGGAGGLQRPGRAPSGLIEVLGRYPMSPRQQLVVLKLDRRVLLLSQTSGGRGGGAGLRTLTEIDDPEEVASILLKARDDEGDSIAAQFRQAMDRHDAAHELAESPESISPRDPRSTRARGLGRLAELA